ncbi:FAD-binding protein, partial [Halarchaeum acidiphilum]
MTTHEFDFVVVGAGTSGCYAAATAAKAGYDVVVV